jgi:hypothetical protein
MAKLDSETGKLKGAISKRTQSVNPKTGQWVKRDTETGQFKSVKKTEGPYKSITKK